MCMIFNRNSSMPSNNGVINNYYQREPEKRSGYFAQLYPFYSGRSGSFQHNCK